jgi:hypothetical protein
MKPTRKQLAYLKGLADQTGTSFTYPHTTAQASAEIRRLQARPRSSAGEHTRERRHVQRELVERPQDASAIRVGRDVRGYGSSACWAHIPDDAQERSGRPRAASSRSSATAFPRASVRSRRSASTVASR